MTDTDHRLPAYPGWAKSSNGNPNHLLRRLLTDLDSQDLNTRRKAMDSLKQMGETALPGLIVTLNTREESVREAAAWALGEIGHSHAVPALIYALHHERSPFVRDAVIWALEMIGDDRLVPTLLEALRQGSGDPLVTDACAGVLGRVGDEHCLSSLLEAMADPGVHIRQGALWALAHISPRLGEAQIRRDVLPVLIACMDDPDPMIAWVATRALCDLTYRGIHDLKEAAPGLLRVLKSDFHPEWDEQCICELAAVTLERIAGPEALEAVAHWRKDHPQSH